jgi:hypothetical protein
MDPHSERVRAPDDGQVHLRSWGSARRVAHQRSAPATWLQRTCMSLLHERVVIQSIHHDRIDSR